MYPKSTPSRKQQNKNFYQIPRVPPSVPRVHHESHESLAGPLRVLPCFAVLGTSLCRVPGEYTTREELGEILEPVQENHEFSRVGRLVNTSGDDFSRAVPGFPLVFYEFPLVGAVFSLVPPSGTNNERVKFIYGVVKDPGTTRASDGNQV